LKLHQLALHPRTALAFLPLALAASCASPGPALGKVTTQINQTYSWEQTHLAPGDRLTVSIADHVAYNHEVYVRETGMAAFLGIGELPAAGRTQAQLEQDLVRRYTETFTTPPRIQVQLLERAARHVIVMGEVTEPGRVDFDGRMSLEEAIGAAGGPLKETAMLEELMLVRWVAAEQRQRAWKIDARQRHWGSPEALYLQPDDVIFIPNTPIDDVDIWVEQYIRRLLPFPLLIPIGG